MGTLTLSTKLVHTMYPISKEARAQAMQQSWIKLQILELTCLSVHLSSHPPVNLYHNTGCKFSIQQYIHCTMYQIGSACLQNISSLGIFWVDSHLVHLNYCLFNGLSKSRYCVTVHLYFCVNVIYVFYFLILIYQPPSYYWISCTMHNPCS